MPSSVSDFLRLYDFSTSYYGVLDNYKYPYNPNELGCNHIFLLSITPILLVGSCIDYLKAYPSLSCCMEDLTKICIEYFKDLSLVDTAFSFNISFATKGRKFANVLATQQCTNRLIDGYLIHSPNPDRLLSIQTGLSDNAINTRSVEGEFFFSTFQEIIFHFLNIAQCYDDQFIYGRDTCFTKILNIDHHKKINGVVSSIFSIDFYKLKLIIKGDN